MLYEVTRRKSSSTPVGSKIETLEEWIGPQARLGEGFLREQDSKVGCGVNDTPCSQGPIQLADEVT